MMEAAKNSDKCLAVPVLANIRVYRQRVVDLTTWPPLPVQCTLLGSTCFPHLFLYIPTIQGRDGDYGVD